MRVYVYVFNTKAGLANQTHPVSVSVLRTLRINVRMVSCTYGRPLSILEGQICNIKKYDLLLIEIEVFVHFLCKKQVVLSVISERNKVLKWACQN